MRDIQVVFQPQGKIDVSPSLDVGRSGELVLWSFYSTVPQVMSAEVEFANHGAEFFGSNTGSPWMFGKKLINGKTSFYGFVPAYTGKSTPVFDKYTVRGLDGAGKALADGYTLDPSFVTDKP